MRLGELNTRVIHQRQDPDRGDGRKREWKPTGKKLWVSIEQLSGVELTAAMQIEARANQLLKTHYVPDILTSDRLVTEAGDRTFNIVAANNVKNQNRELQLTCIEVVQ